MSEQKEVVEDNKETESTNSVDTVNSDSDNASDIDSGDAVDTKDTESVDVDVDDSSEVVEDESSEDVSEVAPLNPLAERAAKLEYLLSVYLPKDLEVDTELEHVVGLSIKDNKIVGEAKYRKPNVQTKVQRRDSTVDKKPVDNIEVIDGGNYKEVRVG